MKTWSVSRIDRDKSECLLPLEFQDKTGEFHYFELIATDEKVVFGGACNTGFIESGYIMRDEEDLNETLQELLSDLETYYNDGPRYTTRIVVNERM